MFEGHTNANQRAHHESVTETPWVKKYVRATIAKADPQGNIRTHEGKAIEHRAVRDDLGMMRQLGLIPSPAETR